MKDMNKYSIDKLCTVLFSYLTRYRMVPALYLLARERQPADKHTSEWQHSMEKALSGVKAELSRILDYRRMSDEDILELVYEHRNLIRYTFHDMMYYYNKIELGLVSDITDRMKYYLPAMAEIVNSPLIEWRHGTFDTGVEHPTILDIGCGNFPYLKLFRRDNRGNIWYAGIDKRSMAPCMECPDKVFVSHYEVEIEKFLRSRLEYMEKWKQQANTVFFGNSLHCMKEPVKLLEKVAKLPNVTKIMVLEFTPDSALNFMFDFHMYMHAGTGAVTTPISIQGWKCEVSLPTTQHVMHTYTRI